MSVFFVEKYKIHKIIKRKIKKANIILDIGCGIRPQKLIKPNIHICIEPYLEYIKYLKKNNLFENFVYLNSTWEEAIKLFPDKSIDSIFMLDFIEHINKKDGLELLTQCERIARKQIIIFTPLGFFPQLHIDGRKDRWGMDGAAFQAHKSGWNTEDFDDSWELTCVKEYHFDDGYGNVFDKPYGIIWAIKNLKWNDEYKRKAFVYLYLKKFIPAVIKQNIAKLLWK